MARRLDRSRPLWEMYLVEGLAENQFALVTKSHLALVDGIDTVDIGQVLLDTDPNGSAAVGGGGRNGLAAAAGAVAGRPAGRRSVGERPGPGPGGGEPARSVDRRPGGGRRRRRGGRRRRRRAGRAGRRRAAWARGRWDRRWPGWCRSSAGSPRCRCPLADLKAVRADHQHTINDVVLAVISGGAALLAADPGRVDRVRQLADRAGPDERDRGRRRADVAGQPGRAAPAGPADRRAEPADAAAPGGLRHPGPQGHRPGGGGPFAVRHRRLRPDHAARARRTGLGRGDAQAARPAGHQRAGTAGAAVRRRGSAGGQLPGAAAVRRPPADHRRHLLRRRGVLRADRRPGRRSATSTCWPSACWTRWRSCWTPPCGRCGSGSRPARRHRRPGGPRPRSRPPGRRRPRGRRPGRSGPPYATWSSAPARPLRPPGPGGAGRAERAGSGEAASPPTTKKAPAKKAAAKKAPAKKAAAKKAPAKKARRKRPPRSRRRRWRVQASWPATDDVAGLRPAEPGRRRWRCGREPTSVSAGPALRPPVWPARSGLWQTPRRSSSPR